MSSYGVEGHVEHASGVPARGGITKIRHFDGTTRRTSDWDGLRRDSRLWFKGSDCLVYFYAQGTSQRGASLRIPYDAVQQLQCRYLLEHCLYRRSTLEQRRGPDSQVRYSNEPQRPFYDLYVPAPATADREGAFTFHLTTRNLLALAVGAPVVGEKLSTALINLRRRIRDWNIPLRPCDFMGYLDKQGYLDFTENMEHSLACLKLAEDAQLHNMWIDSFAHCVAMHSRLDLSPEYDGISDTTMSLISRAALLMDVHVEKITTAVGCFLEDDLGPEHLGLSKAARDHLDYFRSFLNSFYVNKFGYFPPRERRPWNKRPWTSMCSDIRQLYDYLADTKSSADWTSNSSAAGGICVIQNVQSFDLRHDYTSLEHPLPLLPQLPTKVRSGLGSYTQLWSLASGRNGDARDLKVNVPSEQSRSANNSYEAMRCALVQDYQRFERERIDAKLNIVEARKVEWLLIYGMLQMLDSITKAPAEVRDVETPSYPLCVSTSNCPPWHQVSQGSLEDIAEEEEEEEDDDRSNRPMVVPDALDDLEGRTSRISIHPDCEADCAEDYFANVNNISRHDSGKSFSVPPSPLARTSSIRTSMQFGVQALQRSVVGSLNKRNNYRRASIAADPRRSNNGAPILQRTVSDSNMLISSAARDVRAAEPFEELRENETEVERAAVEPQQVFTEFDFGFTLSTESHLIISQDTLQQTVLQSKPDQFDQHLVSPIESEFGISSVASTTSNRSSYLADVEPEDSPITDLSSFDGGSKRGSSTSLSDALELSPNKMMSYQPSHAYPAGRSKRASVLGGTYTPKGMVSKNSSTASTSSGAASDYQERSFFATQAADRAKASRFLKERRISTGLDELTQYGIVLDRRNVR